MVRGEEEQKTKRVQDKPLDTVLDADGLQVVRGGFIPRPGGVVMGDYMTAAIDKLQTASGITPVSNITPAMQQPVRQRRPSRHYEEFILSPSRDCCPALTEARQGKSCTTHQ